MNPRSHEGQDDNKGNPKQSDATNASCNNIACKLLKEYFKQEDATAEKINFSIHELRENVIRMQPVDNAQGHGEKEKVH